MPEANDVCQINFVDEVRVARAKKNMKPDRIWPPPKKPSRQYTIIWTLFYLALVLNVSLLVLDWNNWIISKPVRFFVGIPIIVIGSLLVSWRFATLGIKNTSGIKNEFVISGPYRFTRNPQYLGV